MRAQDMLRRPTHLTDNHSLAPGQGQKEALEEGHHRMARTAHPANPTPKPWRSHPPAWHTPPHQASWPVPPSKQSHISINTAHHPAKTPSPEPDASPTDGAGEPKSGAKIQGNPRGPKSQPQHQTTPDPNLNPTQIPTRRPPPLPAPDPRWQTAKRASKAPPQRAPPKQKEPAGSVCTPKECGPPQQKKEQTSRPSATKYAPKGAHDQHAQTPPKKRGQPKERPVPDAPDQTPATTRQAGQQNTCHQTNTKAPTKRTRAQKGGPTPKCKL
ncbi:hypothetical protein CRENBAI_024142 [Crenichthys baileyi]|uniref:Uncharacterized protein n=1 Tax=Crenichthys baileyi TaxID=28760 RepID=A0AAV9SNF6_9TELE